MSRITRRQAMAATAAAASLPRFAIAQADQRPSVTVAVQRIATSNTLDIMNEASNVGTRHFNLYTEMLIDTDWTGDLSLRPGLAESWTRIDGRTIEFKLRPGVKFHNGDELTADDVAYTFGERMFGGAEERAAPKDARPDPRWAPAKVRGGARTAYPAIERIEVIDRHTLRFVNKTPELTLEGRISMRTGAIVNARATRAAASYFDFARKPIGTGPYRVADYQTENVLTLEAFDDYWGGRPPIRTLKFREVPELSSRVNGLLSGEFDFACDITPDQITGIEKPGRHEVRGGLITNIRVLNMDSSFPALRDVRVRRALSVAIDRRMIVDSLWDGRSRVPKGLQFPFYGPMYVQEWHDPGYDPDLAKKLLAEAGYKGEPIPYKVLNDYYTNQVATAQIMVEMWKAVGLNVQMMLKENWSQVQTRAEPRALNDNSMSAFFNDPVSFMPSSFGPDSEIVGTGYWKNDEALQLVAELQSSVDPTRRLAIHKRMLEIVERDDPAIMILHETANLTAVRRDTKWLPSKSYVMDFRARNFSRA
jgi:peptide/nickel transport system substrate-binding protein